MRTRFRKVWCGKCSTMQFAGECGHGRAVVPSDEERAAALHGARALLREDRLTPEERARCLPVSGFATRPCTRRGVIECTLCWRGYLAGTL